MAMAAILDFLDYCQNGHFFSDFIHLTAHTVPIYEHAAINQSYWTLEKAWWPTTVFLRVSLHVTCRETWLYTSVAF